MTYATPGRRPPITAKARLAPTKVASETFLVHDHSSDGRSSMLVASNSLVIRGAEPVVVDTGVTDNEEQFLADVFSIVEPDDIRWVFVSHDDIDHTGNLYALMAAAPNATVVVNWLMQQRMGASLRVSPLRQRWVDDGGRLDVGDRTLHAVRPPIYDSPTTRGLFDPTTGVYWAADAFATPMATAVRDVAALDPFAWDDGMVASNHEHAPWITLVDDRRFQATVDRVQALGASVICGAHTPMIGRPHIDQAIAATRRSNTATVTRQPDQSALEQFQAHFGG